jgi:polysaccharide biosynthesis transport protein
MELRYYLGIVWKWAWLIALSVIIAAASSYFASKAATPLYRTSTTLMVGRVTQNPDPNSGDLYTGQQLAYTYIQLVTREPVLQGALDSLGLNMNWQALRGQVSAAIVYNTQLLQINVIDNDPYRAKVLADAVALQLILQSPAGPNAANQEEASFIQAQIGDLKEKINTAQESLRSLKQELDASNSARQIQDLQNQIAVLDTKISNWQATYSQLLTTIQGGDVNTLSVIEEASIPTRPISPNVRTNVMIAAVIGLVLAAGGVFVIEYLDDTIKSVDDVQRHLNLSTIGSIPRFFGSDYPSKLVVINYPLSPIAEAFRALRMRIQLSSIGAPFHSIIFVSPNPKEGKSICLANLAIIMAQAGMRVILVDADLRRPVQHQIFGLNNESGLSNIILHPLMLNIVSQTAPNPSQKKTSSGMKSGSNLNPLIRGTVSSSVIAHSSTEITPDKSRRLVLDNLQNTQIENLRLLSSGPIQPNPAELLEPSQMNRIIEILKSDSDMILFDSPAFLLVADAVLLATLVDKVVMVNDSSVTRVHDARKTVEDLRRVGANIIGVVLNRHAIGSGRYQYYEYYHANGKNNKLREWKLPFRRKQKISSTEMDQEVN